MASLCEVWYIKKNLIFGPFGRLYGVNIFIAFLGTKYVFLFPYWSLPNSNKPTSGLMWLMRLPGTSINSSILKGNMALNSSVKR